MKRMRNGAIIGAFILFASGSFFATYAWQSRPAQPAPSGQLSKPTQVLGGWLRLMPEQVERIAGVDPTFVEEGAELEAVLQAEREKLARLFEDANATDETIMQQVETVIDVHDQLERRVANHLLALRPHLTDGQRSRLFQTCAKGIRKAGGHRWKHGRGGGRGEFGGPPPWRGQGRGQGQRRGPRWNDSSTEKPTSSPTVDDQGDQP